jgi:hypothetical protein
MTTETSPSPDPILPSEKSRPPIWTIATLSVTALLGIAGTGYYFLYQKEALASQRRQAASPLAYFESRQRVRSFDEEPNAPLQPQDSVATRSSPAEEPETKEENALAFSERTVVETDNEEALTTTRAADNSGDLANQLAQQTQRMDALEARLDALSQQLDGLGEALAERPVAHSAATSEDTALLIQFYRVREQAMQARPFEDTLAALLAMEGLDGETYALLARLQRVADDGIASQKELRKRFATSLEDYLSRRRTDAPSTGLWEDMRGQLGGLIRVRKIGAQHEGDDDGALIARAEAALAEGDLASAAKEVSMLSAQAAPYFADWRQQVRRRQNTLDIFERVERRLMRGA